MAQTIQKYLDSAGTEFDTEAAADASTVSIRMGQEIKAFAEKHFPIKKGSTRGNPHAGTAARAIALWLGSNNGRDYDLAA